ncbi:MAG: class I SAM-dependent methyltransferase [Marmoricola sp.]
MLDGARPSPNIWGHPGTYEVENRAFDREGVAWQAIAEIAPWAGRDVLDIGCGTGFHLPLFARTARTVAGVEPHPDLAAIARRRTRRLPTVQVVEGLADALPVESASVDIAYARWAYFFGPGCEPGIAELERALRPGGVAVILDNDPTRSTFGRWFRAGFPEVDPERVESFWTERGWSRTRVLTAWQFDTVDELAEVVRIELPPAAAEEALAEQDGLSVDYAVNLWHRQF